MARRLVVPLGLLAGLAGAAAAAAAPASPNKPVQILAPTNAARTDLMPVEDGLRALEALQGPVAVVSIVGPYHSGKSFMLNQLVRSLANYTLPGQDPYPGNVFEVGRSVDPQTAGIWAFHRRVHIPHLHPEARRSPMDLLLLDTEGFAVANVSEAYDARIFAASTVLSSLLLYNSMHLIDAKELEYLDLLAHNTQLFSLKAATAAAAAAASSSSSAEEEPEAPAATDAAAAAAFALRDVFQLPPLLWAVQAFTLDLGEETCTSWLTRMLESATIAAGGSGGSSKGKGKGAPMRGQQQQQPPQRLGLAGLFPSMACETLFLPATARSALHDLASLDPATALTPEFTADVASVRDAVLGSLQPKTQGGRPLTGAGLAALVRLVVDGLNQGQLWEIPSRWASFSEHLQVSSVRAAVSHFEAEVSHAFRNATPPLPAPHMAQLVRRVRKQAAELVPRLLVGLDKAAVREAGKEVEAHLRELAFKLTSENEALVREHLRAAKERLVTLDDAAVNAFLAVHLPMTTAGLRAWATQREEALAQEYLATQVGYKDEPRYAKEGRELQAAARRQSERARAENALALEGVLKAAEAACVEGYKAGMEDGLGEVPVLEAAVEALHKPALVNATACLGEHAPQFVGEAAFKARLGALVKAVTEHLHSLQARNSARLDARCLGVREALMANATALVRPTAKSTDEKALEGVLGEVKAVRAGFMPAVHPLGATPECKAHDRLLGEEAAALMDGARQAVAGNLKTALQVPLQEICKVVVEAKCPRVRSLRKLRSTVEGECAKWVRRSEPLGATLSPGMVKRVLALFVDADLPECKAQVAEREKEAKRRWARVALTGLLGLLVPFALMLLTAGVRIEEVEVQQPASSSVAGEGEGESEGGPTVTPRTTTTTVRRRRLSIGGGRLSIGGGTGVTFNNGTPLKAGGAGVGVGSRRTSLINTIFSSPMKLRGGDE